MIRLAMWSGPRNISTAMMRSFENRDDCVVVDEPLYPHYLAATGLDHPAADRVIAAGETDWRQVTDRLTTGAPTLADGGEPAIFYQKHMTHHLLSHIEHDWIHRLRNVLLIRDPTEVVASYLKTRTTVTPEDIGVPQQAALYDMLAASGEPPPVIDAGDFLRDPQAHLGALCDLLGVPFTDRMLSWPAGPRDSDGVWGPWWYEAVWRSTGFEPYRPRDPHLDGEPAKTAQACLPHYERLRSVRLAP